MSSSNFPSSQVALPQQLRFELPASLPDSARSYSVNISPDGVTSVTGPVPAAANFTANQATVFGQFNPQVVSFSIPGGMSPSVFMDPNCTTLSFTMTYTITTATTGLTGSMNLIGSAASWFDSLVVFQNSTPVETINAYGQLFNYMLNNTVNLSERTGGLSVCCGCDTNSGTGIEINTTSTANTRVSVNFCIPLLSVIGANTDHKLVPIGAIQNLQLQMTTASFYPLAAYCSTISAAGVLSGFTLDNFSLNMKYIDVGDMASAMLQQTLQDGKWFIRSQTYTYSSIGIPNGSSGSQQLLFQIRNSSVKSLFHYFSIATGALCPNGIYDAICPSLTSRQLQIGGQFYPNKPISDIFRPAEGYAYLIQALGGSIPKAMGTSVDRYNYNVYFPTAIQNADQALVIPTGGARPAPAGIDEAAADRDIVKFPNSAYYGYDCERVQSILFSGVNTRSSPPYLNLVLGQALGTNVQCYAWALCDCVLMVDTVTKELKSFV